MRAIYNLRWVAADAGGVIGLERCSLMGRWEREVEMMENDGALKAWRRGDVGHETGWFSMAQHGSE